MKCVSVLPLDQTHQLQHPDSITITFNPGTSIQDTCMLGLPGFLFGKCGEVALSPPPQAFHSVLCMHIYLTIGNHSQLIANIQLNVYV